MSSKAKANIVESMKAASLACHSSAGILTAVRKQKLPGVDPSTVSEAARLMRSAEAMARSAAALLQCSFDVRNVGQNSKAQKKSAQADSGGVGGAGGDVLMGENAGLSRAAKKRKKLAAKKKAANAGSAGGGGSSVGVNPPNDTFAILSQLNQTFRQNLPQAGGGAQALGSGAHQLFSVGDNVIIKDLTNAVEYNGTAGMIIADTSGKSGDGRFAVQAFNGKTMRLQAVNLSRMPPSYPDEDMFFAGPQY